MSEEKWAQIVDKITDPLEVAIQKIFSARFLMAVIFTLGTTGMAFVLISKYPDSSAVVWTGYTNITIVIVKDYFARQDREKLETKK